MVVLVVLFTSRTKFLHFFILFVLGLSHREISAEKLREGRQKQVGKRLARPNGKSLTRREIQLAKTSLGALGKNRRESILILEHLSHSAKPVEWIDVEAATQHLSTAEQHRVRKMFERLVSAKEQGEFINIERARVLSGGLVQRVRSSTVSPRERAKVARLAIKDLLTLATEETSRKFANHLSAAGYGKRLRNQRTPAVRPSLREHNLTITRAAVALLVSDDALPLAQREQAIRLLGKVADSDSIPVIREQVAQFPLLADAGNFAIQEISRAANLSIVFATMEHRAFAGTGGLGNVMEELPAALKRMGHSPLVIMPRHTSIDRNQLIDTGIRGQVTEPDGSVEPFQLLYAIRDGVPVFFIENDKYFSANRYGLYGDEYGDFGDNAERYDFFGAAVPIAIRQLALQGKFLKRAPDIVQCNDAHTGPSAFALAEDSFFKDTRTIFAIHNLGGAYQGKFDKGTLPKMRFRKLFYPTGNDKFGKAEFYDQINLMKLGVTLADGVITVSRGYKKETLTAQQGQGMEGVLREINGEDRYHGNLNGIDPELWDPGQDPYLKHPYSFANLEGKKREKAALQSELDLPVSPRTPIVGVVARLTDQKGFDEVLAAIDRAIATDEDVQFIVSGNGEPELVSAIKARQEQRPDKVRYLPFSTVKEHQIYAASDFFFMPSKFEPSGLPQMYALRYLTIPIVRAVGGLDESIPAWNAKRRSGKGFKFEGSSENAVTEALSLYRKGEAAMRPLLRNAALSDFSWGQSSAVEQIAFFRKIMNREKKAP